MASVLADFVAHFTSEEEDWEFPIEGRILLSEGQLVLAKDESSKITIPLSQVFDINIGTKPQFVDPMPGTPVTVAYRNGMSRSTAVISASDQDAEKFRTVLFKAILNGTYVSLKHPEKVGGRVVNSSFEGSILALAPGGVTFDTDEGPVKVPLRGIINYSRETRIVDGEESPVIVVTHMDKGEALTTAAATESSRELSLLGRYLQRTYQRVLQSLQSIQLSTKETETLTTLYTVGDMELSLPNVLEEKPDTVKKILHALHEKGLIKSGENSPVLTAKGQIVVNEYLERVND